MIYAAFTIWLLLIIAMGMAIYRQWTALVRPQYVNYALLPGTIVSEMAYIFGCLITGGEIKRAKLIDSGGGKGPSAGGEGGTTASATVAAPRLKFIGPAVASLLAIVACGAAILAVHAYLGKPVIETFSAAVNSMSAKALPASLPGSWDGFWELMAQQVRLLQKACETYGDLHWLNWRVPLFVYLAACLSIRLAPARKEVRAMLASAVLVAGAIALAGALSDRFHTLMLDLWPLVTYVWASLLFLLVVTLLVRAIVALVKVLAGK
jgi:hypothetical protein